MIKNCTALWRGCDFEVKIVESPHAGATFQRLNCVLRGRRRELCMFQKDPKSSKNMQKPSVFILFKNAGRACHPLTHHPSHRTILMEMNRNDPKKWSPGFGSARHLSLPLGSRPWQQPLASHRPRRRHDYRNFPLVKMAKPILPYIESIWADSQWFCSSGFKLIFTILLFGLRLSLELFTLICSRRDISTYNIKSIQNNSARFESILIACCFFGVLLWGGSDFTSPYSHP